MLLQSGLLEAGIELMYCTSTSCYIAERQVSTMWSKLTSLFSRRHHATYDHGSQNQEVTFQDQIFSKFQDNFRTILKF